MKTTMTGKNSAKRALAGILAATAMMTALAPSASTCMNITSPAAITASAFEPSIFNIKRYLNENSESVKQTLGKLADLGVSTGCNKIPIVGGMLKFAAHGLFSKFFPEEPKISIEELNDQIHAYYAALEERLNQDAGNIENDLLCVNEATSFYEAFVTYSDMINVAAERIDEISCQDISEEEKIRKISMLFGDPQDWTKDGSSIINVFEHSKALCFRSGLISNRTVFISLYDYYARRSNSAEEAKQKTQITVDYIYSQYVFGYSILAEVLNAQLDMLQNVNFETCSSYDIDVICHKIDTVTNRISTLTMDVFGYVTGDAVYDEEGNIIGYENVSAGSSGSIQGAYDYFDEHAVDFFNGHDYIKEIKVIGAKEDSLAKEKCRALEAEGWNCIWYDLNKGCGSKTDFIYLCYKTTKNYNEAIRDIIIREDESRPDTAMVNDVKYTICSYDGDSDFCSKKGDLNCRAGGADIMFYYTKEGGVNQPAVDTLTIDNSRTGAVSGIDLNKGAGGNDIFLHITKYTLDSCI